MSPVRTVLRLVCAWVQELRAKAVRVLECVMLGLAVAIASFGAAWMLLLMLGPPR